METFTLVPKEGVDLPTLEIMDEIKNGECYAVEGVGEYFTVAYLINHYKFPYKSGSTQFEVIESICQDCDLFERVEFYMFEESEY